MLGKGRFTKDLYLPVLIPTILLVAYGLLVVWSASLAIEEASITRQAMGVVLGTLAAALIWRYDVRSLVDMQTALLIIDIVLMVMPRIPGLGVTAKGMTGWVRIPLIGLRFQPSELGKIVTIFLMASSVAQYNGRITRLKDYVKLCATLLVPFMLILVQPDLGTGLVLLVLGAAIIICGGAKRSWVLVTIALLVLGVALIVYTSTVDGLPHILKSYQLKRLAVFIDPSVDPTGDGYNLQQAKIAVGSGGLIGKGIGNATQAGEGFLPEAHTDFVFALLSEEFGFVGAVLLLALFAWLIFATLSFAIRVESPFVKLVLVGMIAMWTFQILENVGMCIGIMPITGIPLPFISYGSSSMVTQLMCVGVIQSLWRHRKKSA
ncbi:MAG: rod shape-determining protein RodA [Atopobiaceae bacterium]|nr:rod shape-determining protein RodA [Atopobiaceae bacterium]MCH4119216.1 rod shape-determining protein RodA [Atopobiaceae bacterium]MCI1318003.1 rod shape-determining protein RodA [Atopobiaceae bacterium]MCI1388524.1 rod shape-determining protein RodA [Atopobiaceae bacterium]MCI1432023.1 rod shape-determining protein RodA [Atopobiaceae bacterium]